MDSQTEKALRDLYYSYQQYISSPAQTEENAPIPLLQKQREYRQIIPPDQWGIPGRLGEDILILLGSYAPPEIVQIAEQVQDTVVRMADEAMSLGRNVINRPSRLGEDRARADRVIGGYYKEWLIRSNRLLNMIRYEFDPKGKPSPIDKSQVPDWDALPGERQT
jgi:hypothetical protein